VAISNLKTKRKYEQKGRLAEKWAALFLQLKGYKILKRRYQNPLGEIDLVLQKGRSIIFCEVKARASFNGGLEALSPPINNGASPTVPVTFKQDILPFNPMIIVLTTSLSKDGAAITSRTPGKTNTFLNPF